MSTLRRRLREGCCRGDERKAFDVTYGDIAKPRLLPVVECIAYLVRIGELTFTEAHGMVMSSACRLGATHLSCQALTELVDWVDQRLLVHIDLSSRVRSRGRSAWVTQTQLSRLREDIRRLEQV